MAQRSPDAPAGFSSQVKPLTQAQIDEFRRVHNVVKRGKRNILKRVEDILNVKIGKNPLTGLPAYTMKNGTLLSAEEYQAKFLEAIEKGTFGEPLNHKKAEDKFKQVCKDLLEKKKNIDVSLSPYLETTTGRRTLRKMCKDALKRGNLDGGRRRKTFKKK